MTDEEFLELRREYEERIRSDGRAFMARVLVPLLRCDGVDSLSWYQYTPYFNDDGEVRPWWTSPVDDIEVEGKCAGKYGETFLGFLRRDDERIREASESIFEHWDEMKEILRVSFGDHAHVVAKLDNGDVVFEVEEYTDHE